MPYWLTSTLAATPAVLWVFFGVGVPWALALLPRKDWRDRPLVLCLSLALGPALLTAWMFVLGTAGSAGNPLLRFDLAFAGTVALAALGAGLAWRKRGQPVPPVERIPLAWDEKLLVALVCVALVVRWLDAAYWPFTAYDALWVYGYEGRLYALLGYIPQTIGYYPQFLPLQYTYAQLAAGGIDDHAARAGLMLLQIGSILAVYVPGARLFNRRAGIFAASIWALYPHVAAWSRFGDLEIPLTFTFTGAASFFLMAWAGQEPRRRYAIIAGLLFGIAMWTKPTAGAFVWGVALLLAAEFARLRFNWRAWLPCFETALITGLASAPLGGVWYARNVLLGHNPIDFPSGFWQTLAERSGKEFGWLLLALLALLAYLYLAPLKTRPDARRVFSGLALVLLGLLPSILYPHRLGAADWLARQAGAVGWLSALFGVGEWLALAAGSALLFVTLLGYARAHWTETARVYVVRAGWALLLALPYFVTWFFSYSYHYRLSFAIVPLLILPTAAILASWLKPQAIARAALPARLAYGAAIVALSASGVVGALYDVNAGWDWLWTDKLPDDAARYESGNPALMDVVAGLQIYLDEHDASQPLAVVAPGVKRLPFFLPLEDIRIADAPTRFDQLEGVTYFIDSHPEGTGAYEGVPLLSNQLLEGLNRGDVMRLAWGMDDGIFRYQVYELHLEDRFEKPSVHAPAQGDIVFGGFARLLGHDIGGLEFWQGRKIVLHLYWEVLAPPPEDYLIFIHLRDRDGNVQAAWDGPVARSGDGQRYYTTLVWQPKEHITDERTLRYDDADVPLGDGYSIVVGMYELATGARVAVTQNGKPIGDGYTLDNRITVIAPPEG